MKTTGEFGFTYGLAESYDEDEEDTWRVELPHQCDAWVIASSPSKAEVEATLKQFIVDAIDVLVELRQTDFAAEILIDRFLREE